MLRFSALLVGLFCMLSPVIAQPFGFSGPPSFGLAQVADLPQGDTLNVREGPGTNFSVIGELREGDIVDSIDEDLSGRWALITFGEGQGWVSARYLQAQEMRFSAIGAPLGLRCGGTEPFWSYNFAEDWDAAELAIMGLIPLDTPLEDRIISVTSSNNLGRNVLAVDTDLHTAILIHGRCGDGMSDRIYPWHIHLRDTASEGALWSGCCSAAGR